MRRVLPLAVLSLAIPAAVIALPVLTAPKPSPHPVAPSTQQVAVALPASAALYPASPGALSETPEVSTRNFRMVGLSWAHDPGVANVTAKVRVRTNGSWTGWQQIDSSDSGPDGGSDAGANSAAATADRDGTDPLWVDHADGVQAEVVSVTGDLPKDPALLAVRIKSVPLALTGVQPLTRAISTAGGVSWDAVDAGLMLTALPDTYVAGEMLDWEAPTGGYLLQATFATAAFAAQAIARRIGA